MHRRDKYSWVMIKPALLLSLSLPVVAVSATPVQAPPAFVTASQQTAPARVALASRPEVRSHSFYVFDESTSSVLAARNERVAVPVASITKLLTALVVLDAGQSMQQALTITADDVRGTAGNASRLPVGARLTREDLLRLALMSSENRAAHALCRNYPKGVAACVKAMNRKAAALHMATARFVDPTGLSSGNVASAADLAKLVIAAAGNPQVSAYSTAARHTVTVNRRAIEFRNTNVLVAEPRLAGRRAENRLHCRGRSLPGDADRDRSTCRRDRAAELVGQVHQDRGCKAHPHLDGNANPRRGALARSEPGPVYIPPAGRGGLLTMISTRRFCWRPPGLAPLLRWRLPCFNYPSRRRSSAAAWRSAVP